MNAREKFLEVMTFNRNASPPKWEFGFWGKTVENWYDSGLPKKRYPKIPSKVTTTTSHLYTPAWLRGKEINGGRLPTGIAVMGGGLYWPTQGFPLDNDVREFFNMDKTQILINVNLLFHPMFEQKVLFEDEDYFDYLDLDGVERRFIKDRVSGMTMTSGLKWPVYDRNSWERLKQERINLSDIRGRFPKNWDRLLKIYKNRDFPLAIGGYPYGFFGTLANIMGYDRLFLSYFDDPGMIHDIIETLTDLWIAVYSEVFTYVKPEHVQIWEDISFGSGPMVSPKIIEEFMVPCYKKFTSFLRSEGIDIILLDTDGDCMGIIPLFIEAGITGLYPFEWHCGMDIVRVRRDFPDLKMLGGIPKSEISLGKKRIDEILKPVEEVLKTGGYIPFGDHFIPPEVDWENFQYYRNRLNDVIEAIGS